MNWRSPFEQIKHILFNTWEGNIILILAAIIALLTVYHFVK